MKDRLLGKNLAILIGCLAGLAIFLYSVESLVLTWREYSNDQTQAYQPLKTEQSFSFPLTKTWCLTSQNEISRPLYHDGFVYTLDGQSPVTINSYKAATGDLAWSAQFPNDSTVGTLDYWLIDGHYMAIGEQNSVTVLDTDSGKMLWTQGVWDRGFTAADGKLIVGGPEHIYAYDLATGDMDWKLDGQGRGWSIAPVYDAKNDVIVLNEATYRIVDPNAGSVLFETARLPESKIDSPFHTNQTYAGMLLDVDEAIEVSNGLLVHARTIASGQLFPAFITDHYLLLNDYDGVIELDLTNFSKVWRYDTPTVDGTRLTAVADPVSLNNIVYVILSDATIRALDFSTGKEIGLWQSAKIIDKRGYDTPIVPNLVVSDTQLFASFGTNRFCAFAKK